MLVSSGAARGIILCSTKLIVLYEQTEFCWLEWFGTNPSFVRFDNEDTFIGRNVYTKLGTSWKIGVVCSERRWCYPQRVDRSPGHLTVIRIIVESTSYHMI